MSIDNLNFPSPRSLGWLRLLRRFSSSFMSTPAGLYGSDRGGFCPEKRYCSRLSFLPRFSCLLVWNQLLSYRQRYQSLAATASHKRCFFLLSRRLRRDPILPYCSLSLRPLLCLQLHAALNASKSYYICNYPEPVATTGKDTEKWKKRAGGMQTNVDQGGELVFFIAMELSRGKLRQRQLLKTSSNYRIGVIF